jgi:NAD(P)H-quinone oxidoreductase subunit 5
LTQVGIIVAEIGVGLRYIPLIHILGHACVRALQFLRASSLLQDYRTLENAIGSRLPQASGWGDGIVSNDLQTSAYRLAIRRGYFDAVLTQYLVRPILRVFKFCDGLERRFTDRLSAGHSRESDLLSPLSGSVEESSS